MTRSRMITLAVLAAVTALFGGVLAPASAAVSAHSPYCGLVWGSVPEGRATSTTGQTLTDVRAGRHACYDRLVIDLGGPAAAASYDVRYVAAVHQIASGARVPLAGGAALKITLAVPAYDENGRPTYLPPNRNRIVDVAAFRTFEQVSWAGSFEGRSIVALGTRARLPFRTFTLLGAPGTDQAARLVIDVAHRW